MDDVKPLVNFIIAGAQKGGTTALFDYLTEEPAISLSKVKEVHFFDDETLDWSAPDYRPYHAHFAVDGPDIRGEATPIYIYWPECLERIARYNSNMKLVLLLRDPVERAWSHWKMEFARGVETKPFSWAIRAGRQRLFQSEPWGAHREFSYVERGFYGEQVGRALSLFPREQILILRSEDLKLQPDAVLREVNWFLGIAPPGHRTPRDVHVGREMDYGADLSEADVAFLREVYAPDQARLQSLTGRRFDPSW
ncbi:sulfotransferase [soil metagenome]